jgi:hypothetical protein
MLSQTFVEEVLRENGYLKIFMKCLHKSVQSWNEVVAASYENMAGAIPREKAAYINRRVVELICQELENDPEAYINPIHQSITVTIQGITLRFKKANHEGRPMNIKTPRVEALWYQNTKPLPGEFEQWINVSFTWQLNAVGNIKSASIVFELGDKIEWFFSVNEDGVQHAPQNVPLPIVVEGVEPAPYVATVRDTERAKRIAESDDQSDEKIE